MEARLTRADLPRRPLLQRITPRAWTAIDVVLAAIFLAGAFAHGYRRIEVGPAFTVSPLVTLPLNILATVPVAFRRRWPEVSLACICGALTISTMLGNSFTPAPVLALPLYSVVVKYPRRQSLVVLGIVEGLAFLALGVAAALRPLQGDVTFNVILPIAVWAVGDSVRTRREYQAGLVQQAEEERKRELERAERAVAEERLEIARELHDVVAHSLSVIAVQSGVGRHVIDRQPDEARKALEAVEQTSRSALDELREVLRGLRRLGDEAPALSPAPSTADLAELADRMRSTGIPVHFEISGDFSAVPPGLGQSIYRIVQEALTNVVKHAKGTPAKVLVASTPDRVEIEVTNRALPAIGATGTPNSARERGAPTDLDGTEHHGILGMKERAAAFGGSLEAGPMPGGGFRVSAKLPYGEGR
jgi:signal transduction histidine kinase